jgi:hypothetical protein
MYLNTNCINQGSKPWYKHAKHYTNGVVTVGKNTRRDYKFFEGSKIDFAESNVFLSFGYLIFVD